MAQISKKEPQKRRAIKHISCFNAYPQCDQPPIDFIPGGGTIKYIVGTEAIFP